jgi:ADP-heptose:LPS heptosyltransferase
VLGQARRIAIIKPCCIGDAVMALPAVDSLRAALPDADLHVWTGLHSRSVFESSPRIDRIVLIADVPSVRELPVLVWRLRRERYDLIALLDRSRLLDRACRLAHPRSLAGIRGVSPAGRHEIDIYLGALDRAGIPATVTVPTIAILEDQRLAAQRFSNGIGREFVVLHPGGAENPGAVMHAKRWPAERWAELTRWVHERGFAAVYTGSSSERALCEEIAQRSSPACVTVAAGRLTLMESAALVQAAAAYVGPDSGLSHLSAAAGTPTVVLFGPTNPKRYAPRGSAVFVVARPASLKLPDADLRHSARPQAAVGLDRIGVDEVSAALDEALATSMDRTIP